LGSGEGLVMEPPRQTLNEGKDMAEEEPILTSPPTQDVAAHVADYSNFTRLLKWGAVVCFIVGLVWMLLIKAYW
jgi:hypothetical protein